MNVPSKDDYSMDIYLSIYLYSWCAYILFLFFLILINKKKHVHTTQSMMMEGVATLYTAAENIACARIHHHLLSIPYLFCRF